MKTRYLALAALMAAAPAQALVITPLAVSAEVTAETPGGAQSDDSGLTLGTASVTKTSSYTVIDPKFPQFKTTDTVTAAALQRDDGFSTIELRVDTNGGNNIVAATGEADGYGAMGKTEFILEYRNNDAVAVSPIFNFRLSDIAAETATFLPDPAVEVDFTFDVFTTGDGGSFSASATARATRGNADIVNANNMTGQVQPFECNSGTCFRAAYIFDDISDAILVGVLDPGEIATILVEMSAELTFNGQEQGAYARILDPNGGPAFTYATTFADMPGGPSPAPAPASLALLGLGLAGLGYQRRKQVKAA